MDKRVVRVGVIGIGGRATELMKTLWAVEGVAIPVLCDLIPERMEHGADILVEQGAPRPELTTDYREVLAREDVDGVIVATSWNDHAEIAIAAMKAGKPVGFEVGGASSLDQCWELVKTWEATRTPCMMLENCCYGRYELAVLNMIRDGLFGEVVHCEGGYRHNLSVDAPRGLRTGNQRAYHHLYRNAELYPTHEIGPISKYLDINRGNRFLTLTSTASKPVGLNKYVEEHLETDPALYHRFALGDVVTTVLKCARGETVVIFHDTSLPRPYSRGNCVQGTNGIWAEINKSIYIEGRSPAHKWEPIEEYLKEYEHPIWKEFQEKGVQGGHDGMDYLMLSAFVDSVRNGTQFPIDIYDSAVWFAITCLSEQSISLGSAPVAVPDFTNGKWVYREPPFQGKYAL